MYKIKLTTRAKRELKNISKLHRETISFIFEDLKDDPYAGKPLSKDLIGKFSYKISVYRIIYKVNKRDKVVNILSAGHRATIYE